MEIILFLFSSLIAQSPDTLWIKTYGGVHTDVGYSIQQTFDRGFIIAGYTTSFGSGGTDIYLIKTDSLGDTLWTRTIGGTYYDYGYNVQQTSDSGFIIVGETGETFSWLLYLVKTDNERNPIWEKYFGGSGGGDEGRSVQQTSDGGFIACGTTTSGLYDIYLVKTNVDGDKLWEKNYDNSVWDQGYSVQQTMDHGYIITGFSYDTSYVSPDVYVIKTDSLGNILWSETYGGPNDDVGFCVKQTFDSGYVVVGYTESFGAGDFDIYLIKTNSLGDTLWTKTYVGTNFEKGNSVQQLNDKGFIIGGITSSFGEGSCDFYLIRTDSLGDTLWTKTFGETGRDSCYSCIKTEDGGYAAVGLTESFGVFGFGVLLVKTEPDPVLIEEKHTRESQYSLKLTCSPNPFTDKVEIDLEMYYVGWKMYDTPLRIYDAAGRLVKLIPLTTNHLSLGTDLSPGIYFLKLNGKSLGKVVKVR